MRIARGTYVSQPRRCLFLPRILGVKLAQIWRKTLVLTSLNRTPTVTTFYQLKR